jgi:hypothetical protein
MSNATHLADHDRALLADKSAHLLKADEFTEERLGPRFTPWEVHLAIKPSALDLDTMVTRYYVRAATGGLAVGMANELFVLWERHKWNLDCKRKWKRKYWRTGDTWPDVTGRCESEKINDKIYAAYWREAKDLRRQLGEWTPDHRQGVRLLYVSGGAGIKGEPIPWESETNPMAFTIYVGKPVACPPKGAEEEKVRLVLPAGFVP